ncbi:MarR family transcriptional regulator [Cohnella endophytica]|uniref:MarR family transcriptional regulator n=1 Tax=Cohnella endophytica TaxID=2419778 RepID=A0A494XPF1_9BACL|nr:MarR family transcriptional regulator [Cohnella endophytica]RKP51682.1 MarR family transcriptional regulator [Cohnella endophytica]
MKTDLSDSISESFVTLVPLLNQKLLRNLPLDQMALNLSPTNFHLLRALYEKRKATITELCNHMRVSRPNMTPLVDKLVRHGLVRRRPTAEDRRFVEIEITEEGDRHCREMRQMILKHIHSKLESLDEEDLAALEQCLNTMKTIALKIAP